MTRNNYIKKIAKRSGFSQEDTMKFLDALSETIIEAMSDGGTLVVIPGIKLISRYKEAKVWKCNLNGKEYDIPARYECSCRFHCHY